MSEVVSNQVVPTKSNRGGKGGTRDMRAVQVKQEVKRMLENSDLTIERQISGSKTQAEGPNMSFQVSGKSVETPFSRYYLNTKLDRLSQRFGIKAELRRKERGVEHVMVDVYLNPKED